MYIAYILLQFIVIRQQRKNYVFWIVYVYTDTETLGRWLENGGTGLEQTWKTKPRVKGAFGV